MHNGHIALANAIANTNAYTISECDTNDIADNSANKYSVGISYRATHCVSNSDSVVFT